MKSIITSIALVAILAIAACTERDSTAPSVTITSPTTDTTYAAGDIINIDFSVTDESNIDGLDVESLLPGEASITAGRETPSFGSVMYTVDENAPPGRYGITILVTDVEDNVGSDSLTVVIF